MQKIYIKSIVKRENGTTRVATINTLPEKTDQSFKDDCDINSIIAKFKKTGQVTHQGKPGVYADVSELPDLMTAASLLNQAEEAFMQLPAQARKRFQNNPENMIEFLRDPENHQEAVKMGLMVPKPETQTNDNLNDDNTRTPKTHKKAPNTASKDKDNEDT